MKLRTVQTSKGFTLEEQWRFRWRPCERELKYKGEARFVDFSQNFSGRSLFFVPTIEQVMEWAAEWRAEYDKSTRIIYKV